MATHDHPVLNEWRQGDLSLAPLALPIIVSSSKGQAFKVIAADHGVAVLTQTCDLVRAPDLKPYVQLAGLVPVTDDEMQRIQDGMVPTRVYVPGLEDRKLAIDLENCATVTKEFVAGLSRSAGCPTDESQRRFADALARHRQRFAFPDAFNDMISPIRKWVSGKKRSDSSLGRLVRAIQEIRVAADDWDGPSELTFLVLLDGRPPAEDADDWQGAMTTLEKKAREKGRGYPAAEFQLVTYDDISAREYRSSDRLDWEGLSDA